MSKFREHFEFAINVIQHSLILSTAVYILIVVRRIPYISLSWHAGLSALGYHLLMAEGIVTFSSGNFWSSTFSRKSKAIWHLAIQILGSFFAAAGVTVELVYQRWNFNWDTFHTVFGLIATICLILNFLLGLCTFWSVELRKYIRPLFLKLIHNCLGLFCFVCGMTALLYGYQKEYIVDNITTVEKVFLWIGTIATVVLTSIGALQSLIKLGGDVLRALSN